MALFVHHSITAEKSRKGFQTTTPSRNTFEKLITVELTQKKGNSQVLQQLIVILMLNVIRMFHGLEKCMDKVDIQTFKCAYGPCYWLQKLLHSDEQLGKSMYTNYFKTFYKVSTSQISLLY
jgi:hypothetical protein